MLTIFSTCKPFKGHFAIIQRNAITSWTLLRPRPEIILFGDEEGVAEICQELGLRHIPEVRRAASGAPFMDDIFSKARVFATHNILCYINADVILPSKFMSFVETLSHQFKDNFVLICTPYNLYLDKIIDFNIESWETELYRLMKEKGKEPLLIGADIFVFPKNCYQQLPPLIIGRFCFDSVLIWKAIISGLFVIDATKAICAIHQDHSNTTHKPSSNQPKSPIIEEEINYNTSITPWWQKFIYVIDIPYELHPNGQIVKRWHFPLMRLIFMIIVRQIKTFWIQLLERTLYIRRKFYLYRWWKNK